MDSDEEAYDPWPGCIMDKTGCHYHSYHYLKYSINETFATFFNVDKDAKYTCHELDNIVIDYIEKHNGRTRYNINFHEDLWNFLSIPHDKVFKLYHINDHILKFITKLPDSEQPTY